MCWSAAAMGDDFSKMDVVRLQSVLKENGVFLHEKDLPTQVDMHPKSV